MKEIINKLDFIEMKTFCSVKDTDKRMKMKKQATEWDIYKSQIWINDCYPKYRKNY